MQAAFILFAAAGLTTVLIYLVNQGKALAKTLNESECNCTKKESEEEKSEKRKERIDGFVKNNWGQLSTSNDEAIP